MINYAKTMAFFLPFALYAALGAAAEQTAQSPVGQWRVKDGTAHIRILACGPKLWGVISWIAAPDTDKKNPDPSKRSQPLLGLPVLLQMQPDGANQWSGGIYNAQNGKTYDSTISLQSDDVLHVHGCALYKIVCGSENWTRLEDTPGQEAPGSICRRLGGV